MTGKSRQDSMPSEVMSPGAAGRGSRGKDLTALRRYWQNARKDGHVPRRADIDPRGIEALLENVLVAERIAPGLARLRIVGQHLTDLMGMEMRGMPLSALITPAHRDQLAEALACLFERPAIVTLTLSAPGAGGQPEMKAKLVLLPLRSELGDISRLLGCLETRGRIGRTPRRFDITRVQIDPVDAQPVRYISPVSAQAGFGDVSRSFGPAPAPRTGVRPCLRLVRSQGRDA